MAQRTDSGIGTVSVNDLSETPISKNDSSLGLQLDRECAVRTNYRNRIVVSIFVLLGWMLGGIGCAARRTTEKSASESAHLHAANKAPVWAVQLNWSPNGNSSLQVQYNSKIPTLAGTSKPTKAIFADGQTYI